MSAYAVSARGLVSRRIPQGVLASMNALLFNAGQQGVLYDPSDLSTLFQDSAGTTPVTAMEQPVGLMLDKSKGLVLGDELVTGGGFDDPANWTSSTWTVSAGVATYPDTINDFIRPANANLLPLVAGKFYRVRFTLSGVTGSAVCAVTNADGLVAYTALTTFTTDGEKQFIIYAAASTTNVRFYGYTSSGGTWSLDDFSIKELPGNHASQATTTKRGAVSRRVNLLEKTEQFDGAGWNKDAAPGAGTASVPIIISNDDGLADKVTFSATGDGRSSLNRTVGYATGSYFGSVRIKAATPADVGKVIAFRHAGGSAYLLITLTADYQVIGRNESPVAPYTGVFELTIRPAVGSSAGVVSVHIAYASLTLAIDAHLPYQWVNTATDYDADPNKFPTYIRFDGVDDAYQTNSIDFTGTDKMTVWAGYNYTKTTGSCLLVELSDTSINPGAFSVFPRAADGRGLWSVASPQATYYSASDHAYSTVIQSVGYDRAGGSLSELIAPRIDGALIAPGGGSFYTPQNPYFANGRLNIGARNGGTTHFFGGRLYSLIVAGANYPLTQIEAGELHIKRKMKLP